MRSRLLRLALSLAVLSGFGAVGSASADMPSCAWAGRLDPTLSNTLYPDEFARYWVTAIPAVPGSTLTIRGRFPYARYMSFTSYNAPLQSADGLPDIRIAPDNGSANPFLPGADRMAPTRHYTVHVVFKQRPGKDAAPNTLYTTSEDGSRTGPMFVVALRVYRPDLGRDEAGGVPLPSVTVNFPGGVSQTLPTCPYPGSTTGAVNVRVAEAGLPWPSGGPPAPGTNPPTWHRYYNALVGLTQLTDNGGSGTALSDGLMPVTTVPPKGGLMDNPDNAYVYATMSPSYGETLLIRGRLPSTPRTYPHAARMAPAQLRYWSLCTYETAAQRYLDCEMDDTVAVDRLGFFTVVVSSGGHRPANARPECGISWLPGGPLPETLMIVRNMLPSPGFRQAIQNAPYGGEAAAMGAYFPVAQYMSVADVEARGCRQA